MKEARELVLWSGAASELAGWSATAASGSRARISAERRSRGAALRLDFELTGHGAWATLRHEIALTLPAHYVVTLRIRGEAPPAELQLKLVDASGANVWWWRRADFAPGRRAQRLTFRRASLAFAWGPRSGGEPERLGAVEFAVAAAEGAGWLAIDELRIEPRELVSEPPRVHAVRASSSASGCEPERLLDGDGRGVWRPAVADAPADLRLDLGALREWGGLVVDYAGAAPATEPQLLVSNTGKHWHPLPTSAAGAGQRRWLRTGETESRFARLTFPAGAGDGIARLAIAPIELAVSPARYAAALASAAPRGRFPRHLLGEQADWAVVGGDGDEEKALLGADGALEVGLEGFSVEPFLWTDGRLHGWADATLSVSLADGCLPLPSVSWDVAGLRLRVTAFAAGEPGRSTLVARYTVENPTAMPRDVRLFLALRPFQVTPAWQSLNLTGAVAPITRLSRAGDRVRVNETHELCAVTRADGFGAALSEEGLRDVFEGRTPARQAVDDPLGFAEGALAYELRLPARGSETIALALPFFAATPPPPAGLAREAAAAWSEAQLASVAAYWRERLAVPIALPPVAAAFEESLRASLGWILVNRAGPRIQPGPRTYRRSWIRDGALTGTALAELGFADEARAFLRWYAPHQYADGRVPCAVDARGVDATVEHDSHGELAWAIVEVFRLTGDRAFLRELWPHVAGAARAIAALLEAKGGLLPISISHEGYASQPVHSYWDDFFALCGLAAAAEAAAVLGEAAEAERFGAVCAAMARDLGASLAIAMAQHGIDFLPGSLELGDFDPTSSAIAFDPCGAAALLPPGAAERTFERYWREREARREQAAESYTPYEVRNVSALLQLGWKPRALALLDELIADQQPTAWRQWPEISHRDRRAPRFLGDLPHGWVASSFLRSVRRLLAYEREADGALVLAAGVPEAWLAAPGVLVRRLPTHYGALDLELAASGDGGALVTLGGGLAEPPGGIVLVSPLARPLREVRVDGRAHPFERSGEVKLRGVPARIELR